MSLDLVIVAFGLWSVTFKSTGVDPDLEFCTCAGYYFSQLKGKQGCYHLDSVKIALMERRIEPVVFTDAEYGDFIASLIAGMMD